MLAEGKARWEKDTDTRIIMLRPDRPDAHKAQIMLHEFAHIDLHQQPGAEQLSTEAKEWEAESVAYIVASHYGLETFSDLYLAVWQVQEGTLGKHLKRISDCARNLIEAIDETAALPAPLAQAA
jgi:hypothetical protein